MIETKDLKTYSDPPQKLFTPQFTRSDMGGRGVAVVLFFAAAVRAADVSKTDW